MTAPAPSLPDIIAAATARAARNLRVSEVARVESYDPVTGKISATPWIEEGVEGEDGARRSVRQETISNIPVAWPGGGGMRITFGLKPGDTVLLVYSDSSLDRWLVRGGFVDPADDRAHHDSDCVAFPTIYDFGNAPPAPGDRVRIGPADGDAAIEITDTRITAGGNDALALHAKLAILWNHVNALFTGGTGSVNVPIVGTLGNGTQTLKGG
jgi:hypothetical protein